jgi:hypothetical protein
MVKELHPHRRKALEDATKEIASLHAEWKATLEHHRVRVEAQFRELRGRIAPPAKGRTKKGMPDAKHAEGVAERLGKVRLKPAKGRAKDLRHVEELVGDVLDHLPEQD